MTEDLNESQPGAELDSAPATPSSRSAAWLEQQAGYVLILVGTAMLVLGAVLADKPAAAPLFVVFGAGLVVLGAFSSRIEGGVEATRDGIRTAVRAVARRAEQDALTPEELAGAVERAIDRITPHGGRGPRGTEPTPREVAEQAVVDEVRASRERESSLINAFGRWLGQQDFEVRPGGGPGEADIIGRRGDEVMVAEAKFSRSPLSSATVRQVASFRERAAHPQSRTRAAVVIPSNSGGVGQAAQADARTLGVEIYGVDMFGEVFTVIGPDDRPS